MVTIAYGDVKSWKAAPLGQAGDGLKLDVKALEESRDTLETQTVPDSWQGLARFFAEGRRNSLVQRMSSHIEGKRQVQRGLYRAEAQVIEVERLVTDVEATAKADEFTIGDDGSVTDTSTSPQFPNRWEAEEWSRIRQAKAQAIADDVTTILAKAAAADATIADRIPSGHVEEVDEYGTPDPGVSERWAELTDTERQAIIEEMIEELADESGLDNPNIIWDDSMDANGQWEDGEPGTVRLNPDILADPRILHTVPHEVRHGRQSEAIRDANDRQFPWEDDPFDEHEDDGITEEQVKEWEENFDNYQSTGNPGVTYDDYFNQPVEADARDAGREYLDDDLTAAELDRLLEESR